MGAVKQDSTNSFRIRKSDQVYTQGLSFSTRSFTIGQDLYNTGTNSFVYGRSVRNTDVTNGIISGVEIIDSGVFNKDYLLRGMDLARSTFFSSRSGQSITASLTDYFGNRLSASANSNFCWFSEILLIGTVPLTQSSAQQFFITYGFLGLSHSWNATAIQTIGGISTSDPVRMTRSGTSIFISPPTRWVGTNWDATPDGYINAKLSICDPFHFPGTITLGPTTSQTNENDSSSLKDGNFKSVGQNPPINQTISAIRNPTSYQIERDYDHGRILNFRNSLVQGTNLNIDFYPSGMSNSVITGFRYPPIRDNLSIWDFYKDDLYSEFNAYNCSHLSYFTTPPTGYVIPEIVSMTKTSGQVYTGQSFSVNGYSNYAFAGGKPFGT
jgi:hypothetical protein